MSQEPWASVTTPPTRRGRWYEGKMWAGMDARAWFGLLARNGFAVAPSKWPAAAVISSFALSNSVLGGLQRLVLGRRIDAVALPEDPVFIIGHWRSGTTMLHELLVRDPRHTAPTTYQSLTPHHSALSERWMSRWLRFMLPRRRPMDDMRLDWQRPQEDEVAICNLGARSPFLTVAFPNRPLQDPGYETLEHLPAVEVERWMGIWLGFLRQVLFARPGVLVLKSPQHAFRLPLIARLFPRARYVHVYRDPYVVFPSAVHFWTAMYRAHGLQEPTNAGVEEFVLDGFARMNERIATAREGIDRGRWHDIRYEDLAAGPMGEMRRLYERLGLGDFAAAAPGVAAWQAEQAGYRTNRYDLAPAVRAEIAERWAPVFGFYERLNAERDEAAEAALGSRAAEG